MVFTGETPVERNARGLEQGVYLPPSAFESWFVSAAHDDEALGRVAAALPAAARAAAAALPEGTT